MKKKIYSFNALSDNEMQKHSLGYIRNMLCDNGVNKKRNGWHIIGEFRNEESRPLKINGIFEYRGMDKSVIIVHAEDKLYECGYDFSIIKEIPKRGEFDIGNEKSSGLMYDGYLWLVCKGGLLIYDGNELASPYGIGFAYAPTTTVGIHEVYQEAKPTKVEKPNLLTGRRINCLTGTQTETKEHHFRLDARAMYGKPFSLKARFRVASGEGKGDDWTSKYVGKNSSNEGINTIVNISFYIPSLKETTMEGVVIPVDDSGQVINVSGLECLFEVTNGYDLTLKFDAVCPYGETDNIVVEFYNYAQDDSIFKSVNQIAIGETETGKATIVISTNERRLYYSVQMENDLYFASDNVVTVGKDAQKITGLMPMANNYVGIYKESSFYTLRINEDTTGKYKLYFSDSTVGCACPKSIRTVDNDCLALNYNGIFGVCHKDNAEYGVARFYNRSRSIEEELCSFSKEEIENAYAIVINDEYWLFVGGRVYICTPKYKIKGADANSFTYQWWVLDGCKCECAIQIDGKIYMGRDDGYIAAFDNEYTDRERVTLNVKDADFVLSQENDYLCITFNSAYEVKSGDKIRLSHHYYYGFECEYKKEKDLVYVSPGRFLDENGCVALYEGMKFMLTDLEGEVVYRGKIKNTYNDEFALIADGEIGLNSDTSLRIYFERDEKTEYVLIKENDSFMVFYNEMPVILLDADVERAYLIKSREVECELVMNITDLGTREPKSLYGISITPTRDTRCMCDIGYETRNGPSTRSVVVSNTIDFDDFDYSDPLLAPTFVQSITVPFFERNFEYIKVKVGSRSGGELGIEKISIIYSTKK
ncbi:MAG: hypothetical protein J6D23_03380 [Clostridia bacterium]|nr:hypothetical protein [Clostridia bacterium]